MGRVRTETMATVDAHQPDRPFHRRVCSPATGHARRSPGAPPDVPPQSQVRLAARTVRLSHRRATGHDAGHTQIRAPSHTGILMIGMLRCHICPNVLSMSGAVKRALWMP